MSWLAAFAQSDSTLLSHRCSDTAIVIPWSEFTFAGHRRYTIDGLPPLRESRINPYTLGAAGTIYTGIMVGLHFYQKSTIWNERAQFRVIEDGDYARGVDKLGHIYGAYIMSYYSGELLQGSGVAHRHAMLYGALMGIVYQSYVEFEDGVGKDWGFSPSDLAFNLVGAGFFLLQQSVPVLQYFSPKWQYIPAHWYGEAERREGKTFIDDYSSSTFFLSAKIRPLLPESVGHVVPQWLALGVGYGVRGLGGNNGTSDRRIVASLDLDLVELLPDFEPMLGHPIGSVLNWLAQSFNYFKIPTPAIEWSERHPPRVYLLYPFKLTIGGMRL
ncbi:MAG: YfiM family protein [Chlorobi bacterium]|nr:YfiM family protein [Chlorobiota bacterium]